MTTRKKNTYRTSRLLQNLMIDELHLCQTQSKLREGIGDNVAEIFIFASDIKITLGIQE